MANSWLHAQASARFFGGKPEDYHKIHLYIDQFKSSMGDVRHRAFLHNTTGPFMVETAFGPSITIFDEKKGREVQVQVRDIAENHIVEDLGWIPSPADWADCMSCMVWMGGKRNKFIGREEMLNNVVIPGDGTEGHKPRNTELMPTGKGTKKKKKDKKK